MYKKIAKPKEKMFNIAIQQQHNCMKLKVKNIVTKQ